MKRGALIFIAVAGAFILLPLLAISCAFYNSQGHFRDAITNPGAEFTQFTGLPFPDSARVISTGDTHGGFHGDGEFHLVFEADRATLAGWRSMLPTSAAGPMVERPGTDTDRHPLRVREGGSGIDKHERGKGGVFGWRPRGRGGAGRGICPLRRHGAVLRRAPLAQRHPANCRSPEQPCMAFSMGFLRSSVPLLARPSRFPRRNFWALGEAFRSVNAGRRCDIRADWGTPIASGRFTTPDP